MLPDGAGGSISAVNAIMIGTTDITAVPEPTTTLLLLAAAGMAAIGLRRRGRFTRDATRGDRQTSCDTVRPAGRSSTRPA